MRQVKATLCVALLLFGTLSEYLHHHHEVGESDSDCVACQFHHAAMEPPDSVGVLQAPAPRLIHVPDAILTATWSPHPLRVAPKTSPPSA